MTQQQSAALLPNPATPAAAAVQGQGGGALAMTKLSSSPSGASTPATAATAATPLLPRTPATPALAALSDGAKILGAFMGGVTVEPIVPQAQEEGVVDEPRFMAGDVLTHEMGESLLHLLQCKHRLLAAAGARDLAAAAAGGGKEKEEEEGDGKAVAASATAAADTDAAGGGDEEGKRAEARELGDLFGSLEGTAFIQDQRGAVGSWKTSVCVALLPLSVLTHSPHITP